MSEEQIDKGIRDKISAGLADMDQTPYSPQVRDLAEQLYFGENRRDGVGKFIGIWEDVDAATRKRYLEAARIRLEM